MKKAEVIKYAKEKRKQGWMFHSMLLEIFNDEEEIPETFVDLVCHKPFVSRPTVIYGSATAIDLMNNAMQEYWLAMQQQQIKDELFDKLNTFKN